MKKLLLLISVVTILAGLMGTASANLLVSASLRNGDYGGGTCPDPTYPWNNTTPGAIGVVNSPNGVTYTSGEGLINWNFGTSNAISLTNKGTIEFTATFSSSLFPSECAAGDFYLIGENKGYTTWNNGQASFSAYAGINGGKVGVVYKFWFASYLPNWYWPFPMNYCLSFDQPHQLGFTWGGPTNAFEIWADGVLISAGNLPSGVSFPWGTTYPDDQAATNIGLGDNHERGVKPGYGSATGVLFSDLHIWNDYEPLGGTSPIPVPPSVLLLGTGLAGLVGWRRFRKS